MIVRRNHVLRETAVGPEPDELSTATELFIAFVTLPAGAVTPVGVDHDEIALGQPR